MFTFCILLYFILELIAPLTFGDPIYTTYYTHIGLLQNSSLIIAILYCLSLNTKRIQAILSITLMFALYTQVNDLLFKNVNALYYFVETLLVFSCILWAMLRPEISTQYPVDKKNILLAFYKGRKGSFIMNFFELIGLPVKSMCIIAGDKALYLKTNKKTFEFGSSTKFHKKADDYVIIDTKVPYTKKYLKEMKEYSKIPARKGFLRIRCIEAIKTLLETIGPKWKPKTSIPSLYLKQIMNGK